MSRIAASAEIADTVKIGCDVEIGENVVIHDYAVIKDNVSIGDNVEIFSFAVIGRLPKSAGVTARKLSSDFEPVVIGSGSVISPGAVIYAGVTIGCNCLIGDHASIREGAVIGDRCLISRNVTFNYNVTVGEGTKILDNTHITGNCKIGRNVFISAGVVSVNDNNIGRAGYTEGEITGPTVCDNVSVGAACILMPSVVLGENSIISAGSVVKKNVKPFSVVAGNPAKFITKIPDYLITE
ncbi:N-acetyltransferase [Seleniivibrio woodruffii]|uniref:Transferase family hexapeptide repeat protein n=1 Tax=Seleniivibrio woodruffii TaxID=1078050 RepID=A0A4R1KC22_9BACT|nr:N-acetyltransferase [Seleniivibrio woodruffii]TCK62138.1 transferase family hexapeptide repeat protein [Seleniivibrio woodruffii]TVZ34745.1 transferase family hexapeptide repeat protein [Seleniivibrio woodruffii]